MAARVQHRDSSDRPKSNKGVVIESKCRQHRDRTKTITMDTIRYSTIGSLTRFLSNNRLLPLRVAEYRLQHPSDDTETVPKTEQHPGDAEDSTIIVNWQGDSDPENPQNWGPVKKYALALLICVYTFAVYVGSSIYTPGQTQVMEEFGVSRTTASLGLALYVLFYGLGTLLFSPLSEVSSIGRTLPYMFTFSVFVILLIPTSLTTSFAGFAVLRSILAFFGSPCLATSGATFQDIFPPSQVPYVIATWSAVATCGPAFGPVLASYSTPVEGWRFSHWEILFLAGPTLLLMALTLPETSSATILTRRARTLRKDTGDVRYMAQAEIDQRHLSARGVLRWALIKPWEINVLDPAVLFSTVFTGLLYGIVYTWFEVFPIVYGDIYKFSEQSLGLAFLAVFVAVVFWVPVYMAYFKFSVEKKIARDGLQSPEEWLRVGIAGAWLIPVGLLIFASTSRSDVHWIASLIGVALANIGCSAAMQSMFLYVPSCYSKYAVSLLAANALARSIFATAAILYAPFMFEAMGVSGGVGLLAGLTFVFWVGLYGLYRYGAQLRSKSRFAGN